MIHISKASLDFIEASKAKLAVLLDITC